MIVLDDCIGKGCGMQGLTVIDCAQLIEEDADGLKFIVNDVAWRAHSIGPAHQRSGWQSSWPPAIPASATTALVAEFLQEHL